MKVILKMFLVEFNSTISLNIDVEFNTETDILNMTLPEEHDVTNYKFSTLW